ncbi:ester cyclase [Couchioplanes caeruleus]|uniref:ester cyclase n=1 Tax=Couchioplanes caeruleus TaxID=56438 RepID=UPI0020BF49AF|nr:ester cyclase [Couchioplanes caeruleus]UQU67711.1 ester cyclase [Couchioplanes caeruleus]
MSDEPEPQEISQPVHTAEEAHNLEVTRAMVNAYSTGDRSVVAQFVDPELRSNSPRPAGTQRLENEIDLQKSSFGDITFREEVTIADGDKVFLAWVATGTDTGGIFGRPPTGLQFELHGGEVIRFRNGLIVEHWDHWLKPRLESLILIDALDDDVIASLRSGGML